VTIFHDCSNAEERPSHRGGGGPKQNDVMRYLWRYAADYGCAQGPLEGADVVITNDCYSTEALQSGLPRLKRMDGTYSTPELLGRNLPLNRAAEQADTVVFNCQFSKLSLEVVYPQLRVKHSLVVTNEVDPCEFFPREDARLEGSVVHLACVATHWGRPEKRGEAILRLARQSLHLPVVFHFIGGIPEGWTLPANCVSHGYQTDYAAYRLLLQQCHGMVHLAWRDAGPKTVLQGLACGLPVFYSHSGGNPELVGVDYGVGVPEPDDPGLVCGVPPAPEAMEYFNLYLGRLPQLRKALAGRPHRDIFQRMLSGYFDAIRLLAVKG